MLDPAQRTAAIDHLCSLAERGVLDVPALEQVTSRALAATTEQELAALLLAVPGSIRWTPEGARLDRRREITARGGKLELVDDWQLGAQTTVEMRGGQALLDLSAASYDSERIDLEIDVRGGKTTVVVPHAVHVVLGDVACRGGQIRNELGSSVPLPGMPVVHVSGRVQGGQIVLRRPAAPRERWWRHWFRGRATGA